MGGVIGRSNKFEQLLKVVGCLECLQLELLWAFIQC